MRFLRKVRSTAGQLAIPLTALALLLLFNLIRDPGFFSITINPNNGTLDGSIIGIISNASELAIIAMGMTLVTSACGGQDISVGAVGAISGAVFVKVMLDWFGTISIVSVAVALVLCCVAAVAFKLFNGTLVAVFKIQPMIATLILYSCGRSIAYWINGSANPQLNSPIITAMGQNIPGVPIPTPIFGVIVMGLLFFLIFKLTNLRLYTQSVGINQGAARLNGINPILVKLLSFVLLGVCVGVASVIGIARMGQLAHQTLLVDIEMDAILAVAIGGNSLGGGKFKMAGSIMGAYIIETLNKTLNAVITHNPASIKAVKAAVIIIIVIAGSPVIKEKLTALFKWMFRNIGKKVKTLGIVYAIAGSIASVIVGLIIATKLNIWQGLAIIFGGSVVSVLTAWIIYALGQVTDDVHVLRNEFNLRFGEAIPDQGKAPESSQDKPTEGSERK